MNKDLEKELENIGLNQKEAKVYLAGLELGPSSAQLLAAKATVNRPSTYIAIESLVQRGLMSSYMKGKRKVFVSSHPRAVKQVYVDQLAAIQDKLSALPPVIQKLESLVQAGKLPTVRMYEGDSGLDEINTEMFNDVSPGMTIYNIVALDEFRNEDTFKKDEVDAIWLELSTKGVQVQTLYSGSKDEDFGKGLPIKWESKRLSGLGDAFTGELTIFGQKVLYATYGQHPTGILIESEDMATMLRAIFKLYWHANIK